MRRCLHSTVLCIATLCCLSLALASCKRTSYPDIDGEFSDDFERRQIGELYDATTANAYTIENGSLHAKGAYNHPLWLKRKLPRDVQIEFDCWSKSKDGDIKVEFLADGHSFAKNKGQYTSTGYVAVMGGWSNSKSLLAKGNEHGDQLVERKTPKVEIGKRYHWKIERKGNQVKWFVDDMNTPFLQFEDKDPLEGPSHAYFAFSNWKSELYFDNLRIRAL